MHCVASAINTCINEPRIIKQTFLERMFYENKYTLIFKPFKGLINRISYQQLCFDGLSRARLW